MPLSRRDILKRSLMTGAYATPVVLSLTTAIEPAGAVTPPGSIIGGTMPAPPTNATVTFSPPRLQYTGHGAGFPPSQPFLFILAAPDGTVLGQSVFLTDATGAATITLNTGSFVIGGRTAPVAINGGNAFVFLADTGGSTVDVTATAIAATSTAIAATQSAFAGTATAITGTAFTTVPPTHPSGPVLNLTATAAAETAIAGSAATQTAAAKTAAAPAATQTAVAQTVAAQSPVVPPQPPTHP